MTENNGRRVLAIGLDAAEPTLVRHLIEEGQMPALKQLLSRGKWLRLESTAWMGSGTVWPTFITGQEPRSHGVYGEWLWHPESMDISRYRGAGLVPFWKKLAEEGMTVGVLDVPFMPLIGISNGFEVSEWGPHDVLEGKTQFGPSHMGDFLAKKGTHPQAFRSASVSGPQDYQQLDMLTKGCLEGIKLRGTIVKELMAEVRPQLYLVGFTEIHRAAHYLWNQVEPEHPVYRSDAFKNLTATEPSFKEIFREIDRQIGEVVHAAGEETAVLVFSLHGMRPAHGAPGFLAPLLCEMGFAQISNWSNRTWRERSKSLMAAAKRRLPAGLKKFYYSKVKATTAHRVARSTMLPLYDWSKTRAFSLPTDQHGWIRINLAGREVLGIVPADQYENTCRLLEEKLRELTSETGRPLVRNVMRTAEGVDAALKQRIPDLVVHWDDSVFEPALRIKGSAVKTENIGTKYVGQHGLDGFCILRAPFDMSDEETISSREMHRLISRLLEDRRLLSTPAPQLTAAKKTI